MPVIAECSVRYVPLSIAIPAFNRCSSVLTLLESVCVQVGEQDEVIVSDDASTDGAPERSSAVPGVNARYPTGRTTERLGCHLARIVRRTETSVSIAAR
jgi:hypothetical protein